MGTIAEKLTYLNTTKIKLRDSLNKFGSSILSTDTFRSYDTKLNDIYDKLPKVTGSGSEFTLTPVQNGQVDDFKMNGVDLEQSETPTPENPQEIKVVEGRQVIIVKGKNLFDKDNANIITAYIGDSYNWTFSGSAVCYRINCKPNTSYTISCANSNETIFRGSVTDSEDIPTSGNNLSIYSTVRRTNNSPITVNTGANAKYVLVQLSNEQYLTSLETLQVEEGSTATNYEPYYEPVSYNIDLTNDLLKYSKCDLTSTTKTWYFLDGGTHAYGSDLGTRTNIKFPVEVNKTYTFRYNISIVPITIQLCYENETMIGNLSKAQGNNTFTFTSDRNGYVIPRVQVQANTQVKITDISAVEGEEDYYDYKLAKMPNTDYKNRIYKSNGNWYYEENVRKYIIDGTESWITQSAYSGYYRYMFVLMENYKNDNLSYGVVGMNSHFIQRITQPHGDYEYLYLQAANNNLLSVYIQIKNLSTIANFKTWLSENNVVVWYPLVNPVTTQITNTTLINQLEAISVHTGTNIITISNDNNIIPEIEITRLKELEKLS